MYPKRVFFFSLFFSVNTKLAFSHLYLDIFIIYIERERESFNPIFNLGTSVETKATELIDK